MTQRRFKDWPIDPNTTSGVDLAEYLNDAVEAADTTSLGNNRPSYIEAGGLWSKGIDGAVDLYLFDGEDDILVGGSGAADGGMVIADSPPDNPSVGDMWLRTPQMVVYVWNSDYWFQFPEHLGGAGGGGGGELMPGLEDGQMTYWDGSAWTPTSAARIHKTGDGPYFDIAGEFHIHPLSNPKEAYGGIIKAEYYENAYDPWSKEYKNWNMCWFQPNDRANTDPNRRNGFDFRADRFTIRLSPTPQDDAWDEQEIVFRADSRDIQLGAYDYRAKIWITGDTYQGMSTNFIGQIVPNPDTKPGTTFNGGMAMIGSYIDGEPLEPINNAEQNDLRLVRLRAFQKDSGIDMTENCLYGLADPDEPQWSGLRESMPPTMKWLEENSLVADANGVLVSKGSTQFGDSNNDEHDFRGDVYIGWSDGQGRPDNNDQVGGTLFLERGIIVGRGNTGNAAIAMEGNIIFGLGDPTDNTCAVSKGYVDRQTSFNADLLSDLESTVQASANFDDLKAGLLEVLSKHKDIHEAAKGEM